MKPWRKLVLGAASLALAVPAFPGGALAGRLDVSPEVLNRSGRGGGGFFRLFAPQPTFPIRPAEPQEKPTLRNDALAAPALVIESPEYYTFNAEPLKPIDFAPLQAMARSASADPAVGSSPFRQSLGSLEGFEYPSEKQIADALLAYYQADPDFIWITDGLANERARGAMGVFADAAGFGLDPHDYALPASPVAGDGAAAIRFEMAMSARVLRYLRDARNGRLDPNKLSGYHDLPVKPFDGKAELARMLRAKDTRLAMEAAHPQMPEYRRLRDELAALSGASPGPEPISVSADLLVNPGGFDPDLPKVMQLIARKLPANDPDAALIASFGASGDYVSELVPVVRRAQKRLDIRADGVIGPRTIKALTGGGEEPAERVEKVKLALEQLRWLPRTLGDTRVFINQPAFAVSYMENGAEKLSMRAVVGKKTNQTSYFYDTIEQVDYNPYWGVPQSILVNEMLPRLRRDPGYLDRAGYEVTNAKGQKVSSSSVSWGAYGSKIPFNVRQTPSEANALGELKILFPNEHAIYMHDTPQKKLFGDAMRAYSHGCVRLEHPREMAAAVLGQPVEHVAEKLAKGHSTEKTRPIPVYVAYFTAWPDASGTVGYYKDVYERDAHLEEALEKVEVSRLAGS
jgi:L,D-transpeptidase YcbB